MKPIYRYDHAAQMWFQQWTKDYIVAELTGKEPPRKAQESESLAGKKAPNYEHAVSFVLRPDVITRESLRILHQKLTWIGDQNDEMDRRYKAR